MNRLHSDKLLLIDRVINELLNKQLAEMAEQMRAAQAQTQALDNQYGKCRRPYAGGQ